MQCQRMELTHQVTQGGVNLLVTLDTVEPVELLVSVTIVVPAVDMVHDVLPIGMVHAPRLGALTTWVYGLESVLTWTVLRMFPLLLLVTSEPNWIPVVKSLTISTMFGEIACAASTVIEPVSTSTFSLPLPE